GLSHSPTSPRCPTTFGGAAKIGSSRKQAQHPPPLRAPLLISMIAKALARDVQNSVSYEHGQRPLLPVLCPHLSRWVNTYGSDTEEPCDSPTTANRASACIPPASTCCSIPPSTPTRWPKARWTS